jgi:hypothetical protein
MVGEYLGVSSCAYADMDPDQDGFTIRGDWRRRMYLTSSGITVWPTSAGWR